MYDLGLFCAAHAFVEDHSFTDTTYSKQLTGYVRSFILSILNGYTFLHRRVQ